MKSSYQIFFSRNSLFAAFSAFLLFSLSACVVYVPEGERRAAQAPSEPVVRAYYYDTAYMFHDDWGYPLSYVPVSVKIFEHSTGRSRWIYGLTDERGLCRFRYASGDYGVIYVNYMDRSVTYPSYYRTNLFFNVLIIDFHVPPHSHVKGPVDYKIRGDKKDRPVKRHGADDLSVGVEHSKMGRDFSAVHESYGEGRYNQSLNKGNAFIKKYSKEAPKEYIDEVKFIVEDSERLSKESKRKGTVKATPSVKSEKDERRASVMNSPVTGESLSKGRKDKPDVVEKDKDAGKGSGTKPEKNKEAERIKSPEDDKGDEKDFGKDVGGDNADDKRREIDREKNIYRGNEGYRGRPNEVPRTFDRVDEGKGRSVEEKKEKSGKKRAATQTDVENSDEKHIEPPLKASEPEKDSDKEKKPVEKKVKGKKPLKVKEADKEEPKDTEVKKDGAMDSSNASTDETGSGKDSPQPTVDDDETSKTKGKRKEH